MGWQQQKNRSRRRRKKWRTKHRGIYLHPPAKKGHGRRGNQRLPAVVVQGAAALRKEVGMKHRNVPEGTTIQAQVPFSVLIQVCISQASCSQENSRRPLLIYLGAKIGTTEGPRGSVSNTSCVAACACAWGGQTSSREDKQASSASGPRGRLAHVHTEQRLPYNPQLQTHTVTHGLMLLHCTRKPRELIWTRISLMSSSSAILLGACVADIARLKTYAVNKLER